MSAFRVKKFSEKEIIRFEKTIKSGLTITKISHIYGVSSATIRSWADKFGFEIPKKK